MTAGTTSDLTVTAPKWLEILARAVGEKSFTTTSFRGDFRIQAPADRLIEILGALKDQCGFNLLSELGGTDYLGYPGESRGHRFEVHYILTNLDTNELAIVKAGVNDPKPTLPSVVPLWLGANWMEREVFDMFGIVFEGHPDLRRILMPEEFTAFPLRKDYPLRGRGERHNFPKLSRGES